MKLYALYKDGELYKVSYKQNVPFYDTPAGAKKAFQHATSRKALPWDMYCNRDRRYTEQDIQSYLDDLKKRMEIHEFTLVDEGVIFSGE